MKAAIGQPLFDTSDPLKLCLLCHDPSKVTQWTQLRLSGQKLPAALANLWVVLEEKQGGERVQSLNYALTMDDSLWVRRGFNPQGYKSTVCIWSSINKDWHPSLERSRMVNQPGHC